eukprot:Hpha_TRINITY_DN23678_c0_g1::TRINITY_DN23678_c0_g1_i1::g.57641::m.57641/K06689/UBE2D, UBC4, UBC5; ubiquitin-conjugating enzyme E2 D
MGTLKRLEKELKDLYKDPPTGGYWVGPLGDDLYTWRGCIEGPPGTPYAGGEFMVDIRIPMDYPFKPPKVQFQTKLYHPNVNVQGYFSLDILNDSWSPALTIGKVMLAIHNLLKNPEPDHPMVPEISLKMQRDPEAFRETAQQWTLKYAAPDAAVVQQQQQEGGAGRR